MEDSTSTPPPPIDLEHIWQFAGQGLRSSDFNTAMVHFYRGELQRSNVWRQRLDATTNWAVVTTGAALTFAFGDIDNPASVLLVNTMLILLFLFIEARRYRYYELWTNRVRLLETNYFAGLLSPPFTPHADWADKLTESLYHPRFPISLLEAFGRRYRRNYAPIFLILAISWVFKIYIHPVPVTQVTPREYMLLAGESGAVLQSPPENIALAEFARRAQIGPLPAELVISMGFIFNGILIAVGLFTVGLQKAQGEVFEQLPKGLLGMAERFRRASMEALEIDLPRFARMEAKKELAYVITDKVDEVSKVLMTDLKRGVTLMKGVGMYTGKEHGVLMCALTAKQIRSLRHLVNQADPKAFVIITPVYDVHGRGFRPLEA